MWCTGPRVTRVQGQQVACDDPRAERERNLYVLRGLWRYQAGGSHLFVSKPVMRAIHEARIAGLDIWPGLSSFFGRPAAG